MLSEAEERWAFQICSSIPNELNLSVLSRLDTNTEEFENVFENLKVSYPTFFLQKYQKKRVDEQSDLRRIYALNFQISIFYLRCPEY